MAEVFLLINTFRPLLQVRVDGFVLCHQGRSKLACPCPNQPRWRGEAKAGHGLPHGILPSKENEMLLTPPLVRHPLQVAFTSRTADEINGIVVVLLHARSHRQDVEVEDDCCLCRFPHS